MDEVFLTSLRIPGVGKRRARALASQFPTRESLRAATIEEIEAVPGFGPTLARRIKNFAETGDIGSPSPPVSATAGPIDATETEAPQVPRGPAAETGKHEDWLRDLARIATLPPPSLAEEEVPAAGIPRETTASAPDQTEATTETKLEPPRRAALPGTAPRDVGPPDVAAEISVASEREARQVSPPDGDHPGEKTNPVVVTPPGPSSSDGPNVRVDRRVRVDPVQIADRDWLRDFVEIAALVDRDSDAWGKEGGSPKEAPQEPAPPAGQGFSQRVERAPTAREPRYRPSDEGLLSSTAPRNGGRESVRVFGTGHVNGLANSAAGRVNGLADRSAPGQGMVNGLINGNGITNGNARTFAPRRDALASHGRAKVIAALVLSLLLLPVIAVLLSSPGSDGIVIDGQFGDWAAVARYDDPIGDAGASLDLADYRLRMFDQELLVYARVAANLWDVSEGQTESAFAFLDEDGNSATGFQIGGIGVERAAEFYGWEGGLAGSQLWEYDETAGVASDDWRSLSQAGYAEVASRLDQIEARILPGPTYRADRARVLIHTWSSLGEGDVADAIVGRPTGALAVSQRTVAPDILTGTQETFLAFSVRPLATAVRLVSVTVRQYGSLSSSAVIGSLFLDQSGDGILDETDPILSTDSFSPEGTFTVDRMLTAAESYLLRADFLESVPTASVGFRVTAASFDANTVVPVTIADAGVSMSYLVAAPDNVTVDGAFADWDRYALRTDADDDVRSLSKPSQVNENVDLRAHEAIVGANVSMYLRVDGHVFGGADIPNTRGRFVVPRVVDSDGDTVPDDVETTLGRILPEDFNNDNISDAEQFDDVDQDGVLDYNKCRVQDCAMYADFYLETTIPAWYPPSHSGHLARRYVGPISLPPQRGVDTAAVYLDRDNRTDTGLYMTVDGFAHGMDYAFQAVGRRGTVLESALYSYSGGLPIPWTKIVDVPTGIDTHRLEASFDATLVNLTATHTFLFTTTDWRSSADAGRVEMGLRSTPSPATRSAAGPRVFDIPGNQPLFLRGADHGTETACTTNKVASPTSGPGPAASVFLSAGQSACWYADSTAGASIPAGDWETLLDLFLSHGIAVYGEGSVATPRYRESDGRNFTGELSGPVAAGTIHWVVVASSPTGPEKVVGILSSNDFLYVQTWSGATWTSNWNTNVGGHQNRKFDIAYEGQSGDVVVAFGDTTAQLKYRKRVAGSWDGANVNAGAPLADVPYWVRLSPHPTNDDLMAAVSTNADTLHALRWDGAANAWGNQIAMPGTIASKDQEAFDVVYERASGDAFVIWGDVANFLRYREFTSTWGAVMTAYTLPDRALWVAAAADPEASSNRIAVGMILNNDDFEFGAWTGAAWVARPAPVGARDKNERGIDVGFEATTNRAMFVFNERPPDHRRIAWRTWTQAGGFGGVTVEPGTSQQVNFVQLRADPRSNAMMLLYADSNDDLFHRRWSGTAWSAIGPALETSLSQSSQREPFMFAWTRVVEYDVHLEIWDTTTNAVADTIGSCLNQRTYGNDVQCLVTGVPGKVLGPNHVVRVRIAHSSPGGTFGILFDAPGSNGDSRATIPSFVGIPEFETVALPVLAVLLVVGFRRHRRTSPGRQTERRITARRKKG